MASEVITYLETAAMRIQDHPAEVPNSDSRAIVVENGLEMIGKDQMGQGCSRTWLRRRVRIMLSSHDADQERLKAIAENAYRLSPVNDLVRRAVPMNLEIEVDQVLSLFPEIMIASLYRLRDKGIG